MKTICNIIISFVIILFFNIACSKNPSESVILDPFDWAVSSPEEQGLDSEMLANAAEIAQNRGFIHSLLVVRNGYLVAENYFNGNDDESFYNVMSVSKSFTSALTGIVLEEGYLESLDQKAADFFQEYHTDINDPRMNDITIGHLLGMRAGFDSDRNLNNAVFGSSNWIKTTMGLELVFNPGERFGYATCSTHLLLGVLRKATGVNALQFADKYLFKPMKISIRDWTKDPQNYYFGGSDMFFTARDMARFGYLYMQNGHLEGEQIVPQDWISESTFDYIGSKRSSWGAIDEIGYGYLWWTGKINDYNIYFALGHGGQFIINITDLNMIIVTTSDPYVDYDLADAQEQSVTELLSHYVFPAVKKTFR